jgi:hypothetical protein
MRAGRANVLTQPRSNTGYSDALQQTPLCADTVAKVQNYPVMIFPS